MYDLCIKNGLIVDSCSSYLGTIYVKNEKIEAITSADAGLMDAAKTIDAQGCYVMPGFIDPHSHLNDPGLTNSEDFYTGTCSAAAGGITTVLEHPLTFPLPNNANILIEKSQIAESKAVVDFCLLGACTPDNLGEIEKMIEAGAVAFKAFMPFSPEIPQLTDKDMLQHMRNLAELGKPILIHCENDLLINVFTKELIAAGKVTPEHYPDGRPEITEEDAIERMAKLANYTGAKVHIVHCSIPQGIEAVKKYQSSGADLTVETCPHYLALNREDLAKLGTFGVCNPPLRSKQTVSRLWDKVLASDVDFVGSDHATYTFEEKEAGKDNIFEAPPGMTGIQSCFPLLFFEGVIKRGLSLSGFVKLSSENAAKRYGIYPEKGSLALGTDADMVIIYPNKEYTVRKDDLHYMQKWSPYMGWKLQGYVSHTIVRGIIVCQNNQILAERGLGKQMFSK